jgi:hypothetical protein
VPHGVNVNPSDEQRGNVVSLFKATPWANLSEIVRPTLPARAFGRDVPASSSIRPKEDEMALVAANVDGHALFQIEELIEDFKTREVAVLPIEYEGKETLAIGYLGGRHKGSDPAAGEGFIPILAFLPGEMNSVEWRVEITPVMRPR